MKELYENNIKQLKGDVPHFGGPTAMLVSGGQCRPDVATEA